MKLSYLLGLCLILDTLQATEKTFAGASQYVDILSGQQRETASSLQSLLNKISETQ